jgi:hypothetical protein
MGRMMASTLNPHPEEAQSAVSRDEARTSPSHGGKRPASWFETRFALLTMRV